MHNHTSGCDSCAKICEEAKDTLKSLQKKVYALTIVCTSALTLLGEQGAKAVMSTVGSMNKLVDAADGKDAKAPDAPAEHHKTTLGNPLIGKPWMSPPPKNVQEHQPIDEEAAKLALAKKNTGKPKQPDIIKPVLTDATIKNVLSNNQTLVLPEQPVVVPQMPQDAFTAFLTPSALPFDVYSTTLALGGNYGFGEYYGYGSLDAAPAPVPEAGTLSVIAFSQLVNTRRRY